MTTKKSQIAWLLLAAVFVAAMMFFVTDTMTVTVISATFSGVLGTFLGIDILTMIHKTKELPAGTYKNMNRHRYITALIIFAFLLIEAFVLSSLFERDMNTLYLSFGVGFIIVIGGLISGVEANKMVTGEQPPELTETGELSGDEA